MADDPKPPRVLPFVQKKPRPAPAPPKPADDRLHPTRSGLTIEVHAPWRDADTSDP